MKKFFTAMLILCAFNPVFAQNDLIDRISNQVIEIDSLKKVVKAEKDSAVKYQEILMKQQDMLENLRTELSKLEKFKKEKTSLDRQFKQKNDSIALLITLVSEKANQASAEIKRSKLAAIEENEKGKNEILTTIINSYKNKSFDELLKSSTKQSAQRDLQLINNPTEVKQTLSDIEKYFSAKELLDKKLDTAQIKNAQNLLGQIKQESSLLNKLKELIGSYPTFSEELKETIKKINALDDRETVSGMSQEIQKQKLFKILAEVSSYIFNYDFNSSDYPYLSDILLELIKRKQPNADADISDLSKKL